MKCIHCNNEIDENDNFCSECGHFTAKGYIFLKDNKNRKQIEKGSSNKQKNRLSHLILLLFFGTILFFGFYIIRGDNLFKPILYLKKQVNNYFYGYDTSNIKNNNKYEKQIINNYNEAINFIKKDFSTQTWECFTSLEVKRIEDDLENKYSIPSVVFCDMSYDKVLIIKKEIDDFYNLFKVNIPITNITYTNLDNVNNVAFFQPMYQFVNINESINKYNKVNKTQILLNSYYFNDKNNKNLIDIVGNDFYVKDASLESTLVHELGHALSFSLLLKEYNMDNITLETKNNENIINSIINDFNKGIFSKRLVNDALISYNELYNSNLKIEEYANNISKYAGLLDKNNQVVYDEVIAEAIHDYYLHKDNMKKESREIIKQIKSKIEEI